MAEQLLVCACGRRNPSDHRYCASCGTRLEGSEAWTVPSWSRWSEALPVIWFPHHLRRTLLTALVVGSLLFCLNHLNEVLGGHATTTVWLQSGLTYLVPFAVSNIGVLIATRQPPAVQPVAHAGRSAPQ